MSEIAVSPANGALMSFIERAAKDPDFDVQKFGELLRLQRDVGHDQARRAFNQAMAETQAQMMPVVRDAKNSHLGNRYARLETIDRQMRPIYTQNGFSVRYGSAPAGEGFVRLTCTVAHSGGYFEENYLDAPIGNAGSQGGRTATTPVQSVGSTVTYLRRYLLGMVFNIVLADDEDDDDGEASRKAAAAQMRRGDRIAEKAPTYEADGNDKRDAPTLAADEQHKLDGWREYFGNAATTEDVQRCERTAKQTAFGTGSKLFEEQLLVTIAMAYTRVSRQPSLTTRHSIAPPRGAPDADWRACIDKVAPALAALSSRRLVEQMGDGPTCADIIANGPPWAVTELSKLLAENFGRFQGNADDEVEIAGAEKMGAG